MDRDPIAHLIPSFSINGRFVSKQLTGVQRYAREITLELDKLVGASNKVSVPKAQLIIAGSQDDDLGLRNILTVKTPNAFGFFWTQAVLPFYNNYILLSLENIASLSVKCQILCVHDMNTKICPESYSLPFRIYYGALVPLGLRRALSIVTVSKFSADNIAKTGHCGGKEINVIPNGHEHVRRWDARKSKLILGSRPFIFVLGSQARHKNLEVIQSIASDLDRLGLDIVVAGTKAGVFRPIDARQTAANIRFLGYVSEDDLAFLYKRAFCFVFPSLTEGFGLPALEALALGCPVIASSAASLPELCGTAALYANPSSSAEWLAQVTRLLEQPNLRKVLAQEGIKQAEKFSWSVSARLYWDLMIKLEKRRSLQFR